MNLMKISEECVLNLLGSQQEWACETKQNQMPPKPVVSVYKAA